MKKRYIYIYIYIYIYKSYWLLKNLNTHDIIKKKLLLKQG
jgi:hypothetical protein